jgi:hypothetical protein
VKLSTRTGVGTITSVGAVARGAAKATAGSTTASSAVAKSTDKGATGTIATSSTIGKAIGSFLAGVIAATATLSRILNGTGGIPSPGPVDRHSDPIPVMMYREPSIDTWREPRLAGGRTARVDQWQEKSKTERWQPQ